MGFIAHVISGFMAKYNPMLKQTLVTWWLVQFSRISWFPSQDIEKIMPNEGLKLGCGGNVRNIPSSWVMF